MLMVPECIQLSLPVVLMSTAWVFWSKKLLPTTLAYARPCLWRGIPLVYVLLKTRSRLLLPRFIGYSGGCGLICDELAGRAYLQP